jgi:hypothetical protein
VPKAAPSPEAAKEPAAAAIPKVSRPAKSVAAQHPTPTPTPPPASLGATAPATRTAKEPSPEPSISSINARSALPSGSQASTTGPPETKADAAQPKTDGAKGAPAAKPPIAAEDKKDKKLSREEDRALLSKRYFDARVTHEYARCPALALAGLTFLQASPSAHA